MTLDPADVDELVRLVSAEVRRQLREDGREMLKIVGEKLADLARTNAAIATLRP